MTACPEAAPSASSSASEPRGRIASAEDPERAGGGEPGGEDPRARHDPPPPEQRVLRERLPPLGRGGPDQGAGVGETGAPPRGPRIEPLGPAVREDGPPDVPGEQVGVTEPAVEVGADALPGREPPLDQRGPGRDGVAQGGPADGGFGRRLDGPLVRLEGLAVQREVVVRAAGRGRGEQGEQEGEEASDHGRSPIARGRAARRRARSTVRSARRTSRRSTSAPGVPAPPAKRPASASATSLASSRASSEDAGPSRARQSAWVTDSAGRSKASATYP